MLSWYQNSTSHCISHAALSISTSKLTPKFYQMPPPSQRLMFEFEVVINCSRTLLNFYSCSTSHVCPFTAEASSTYLYHKDERALPGNLHSRKCISLSPTNVMILFSLIHSFVLQGANTWWITLDERDSSMSRTFSLMYNMLNTFISLRVGLCNFRYAYSMDSVITQYLIQNVYWAVVCSLFLKCSWNVMVSWNPIVLFPHHRTPFDLVLSWIQLTFSSQFMHNLVSLIHNGIMFWSSKWYETTMKYVTNTVETETLLYFVM
jgi:hypothetical protein